MLAGTAGRFEPVFVRHATRTTDSYGEPAGPVRWDGTLERLYRARLERGTSTVRELEGRTLADDEALLIVLSRWRADPLVARIETPDAVWDIVSDPVSRTSLASGVHTVAKLKRRKVTPK